MRAARIHRYGPPEVFRVDEVAEPSCGPDDVLIDVHASSVNPVDFKIRQGMQRGAIRYRLPWTLGLDVAGEVKAVGDRVQRFKPGDRVYGSPTHRRPGCYAESTVIAQSQLAPMPTNLDFQQAASIPLVGLTTWAALVDFAKLQSGERVLIHAGAGGIGTFAIQLAKVLGAEVATTCSTRNLELVQRLGADRAIDYTEQQYDDVLADYDVAYDTLGGEHTLRSRRILRRGGRLPSIVAGVPAATKRYGPNLGVLVSLTQMIGLTLVSKLRYGIAARNILRPSDGGKLERITELIEAGKIEPVIDRVFPLEEIAEAHRYSETGRARGKIVIAVR